jgi:hypothetical protein
MDVVHSGFDGLKVTVEATIPDDLRAALMDAKARAAGQNGEVAIDWNGVNLAVRKSGGSAAFSAHTGSDGAEWYFLDPQNKPANNPGVTVDFRAFLLATGGIDAARRMFEGHMAAFGIRYGDRQVKVSRADFAVDILAPAFEPDRRLVVAPAGTRSSERSALDEREEHGLGDGVSGVRAGHIANRQLAIYDKRREVIDRKKPGWLTIWNARRSREGKPALDLSDPAQSRVWRFELRLGSKQLRHRWEIRGWDSLETRAGDAFANFCGKVRYCAPCGDGNRSRWPDDPLWQIVRAEVARYFDGRRSFAEPTDVKIVNRAAHIEMLDTQTLGLLVSRAVALRVAAEDFPRFARDTMAELLEVSDAHPVPLEDRLARTAARYEFR